MNPNGYLNLKYREGSMLNRSLMAASRLFEEEAYQVVFEGNSCVKKVILNRPRRFNSITYAMIIQIFKNVKIYENDSQVKLVILKGQGRVFSSGGDVVSSYTYMTIGNWRFGASYCQKLLTLDHLLATYKKPLVALIDGIVMGAGAGLSMHARFKIVTENTVFAMPEAGIGLFPDFGASFFLSRLPRYFGEYLGLTGARLDGAEMIACGLATHFVLSKDLHLLEKELEAMSSSDTNAISQLIRKFAHKPNILKPDYYIGYCNRLKIVNICFSRETVEDILLMLEKQITVIGEEKWIVDAINSMKSACPLSLKIFLKLIRLARRQSLEQCYVRDYTIFSHIIRRTVSNDYYEGVRAKLIDKDKNPKWQPPKLELVSEEMVNRFFNKVDEEDWEFLQLPPRSNSDHVAPSKL